MAKKGQVTVFMIIGLVILIVVALIYGARNYAGIGIDNQKFLALKIDPIRQSILTCIDVNAKDALELIGKQGGTLEPINYRLYNGNSVNYLCTNIPGKKECSNRMILLGDIENELNVYLKDKVQNCANVEVLGKKLFYEVNVGTLNIGSNIGKDYVTINVSYPITLSKGNAKETISDFIKQVDVPLGSLYDHSFNIVDYQARIGDFDQLPYMLAKKGAVEIRVDRPYPDVIYILNMKDSNYIFEFGVEGE